MSLANELAWMDDAACRSMTVNGRVLTQQERVKIFFPEKHDMVAIRLAQATCASCPVQVECSLFGRNQQSGIWGGRGVRINRGLAKQRKCDLCSTRFTVQAVNGIARMCAGTRRGENNGSGEDEIRTFDTTTGTRAGGSVRRRDTNPSSGGDARGSRRRGDVPGDRGA